MSNKSKSNLTELNKLTSYLKDNNYKFTRYDFENDDVERHQVIVSDGFDNVLWDAICHPLSMGYEDGLIEVQSLNTTIFTGLGHFSENVAGYLTADQIISRLSRTR